MLKNLLHAEIVNSEIFPATFVSIVDWQSFTLPFPIARFFAVFLCKKFIVVVNVRNI